MSDISHVLVYTKNNCTYCEKAKNLLKSLGLAYDELKYENFKSIEELYESIGKNVRSMPQIKINGELVGGYNQLVEHLTDKGLVNFQGKIVRSDN